MSEIDSMPQLRMKTNKKAILFHFKPFSLGIYLRKKQKKNGTLYSVRLLVAAL